MNRKDNLAYSGARVLISWATLGLFPVYADANIDF